MSALTKRRAITRRSCLAALVSACCLGAAIVSLRGVSSTVVISQVYGGGGNSGATYRNDFIELFNRGTSPVDLTGWSVQYGSATGTTWSVTPLSGSIAPGRYYLVQEAAGTGGTTNLPTPDATGAIAMSATSGKVALVSAASALSGACPASAAIVDLVGFGPTASCSEGAPTPAPSNTTAAFRKRDASDIEIDTDANSSDFITGAPRPGNKASGRAPLGTPLATPASAPPSATTLLTVAVTPGAGPSSSGLTVTADLSAIGGSSTQPLVDDGTSGDATPADGTYSVEATVASGTTGGGKSLSFTIADAQLRATSGTISFTVLGPVPPSTTLVISQVYGGGGNSGAAYRNDFVELFNLGSSPVSLAGWSVQYASSAGSNWQKTDLAGTVQPGRFYLVHEAAGSGGTINLPAADAVGTIPMAATSGKVALVNTTALLTGTCPAAAIVDFVGYGGANCSETSPTPALNNTTAATRTGSPPADTNNNSADFTVAPPAPRNSTGTPPLGAGLATPASGGPGDDVLLTVAVTPGQFPPAGGLAVSADLGPLGGPAAQALFDDGTNGDGVAGDNIFSLETTVGAAAAGPATVVATVSDALARQSTTAIALAVEAPLAPVHQVQGSGSTSPLLAQFVTTGGIVTGVKLNGFFVQTPDSDVDGDPMTSEGLFVFTGGMPPAAAAPGNLVRVSGTVTEFIPSADPASPPITEVGGGGTPSVAVRLMATANVLPSPTLLTAADTSPAGALEQLERFEGMRIRVDALRVAAPTQAAFVDETTATSVSNGVFYGVIDGLPRPLREPGIDVLDVWPAVAPCCVPRFDGNPERLRVDSDGLLGAARLDVNAGALVSNLVGPLDFSFRTYTVLPEPATPALVSGLGAAVPVPAPDSNEFTLASFNTERFFDTVDDPAVDDPVLTPAAFDMRLRKASLAIRQVLRSPDIIGVQEVENLTALQALAGRINADTVAAGDTDPQYTAYLVEGNDIGGIDSGFLVKQSRVVVADVTQAGAAATFVDPSDGSVDLMNDRPPLILRASVLGPLGSSQSVTVIVNHLRSLSGVNGADGVRIRAKRKAQAEFLAALIQARQAADPAERLVSLGDYNAFPFNDGYVDVVGTVKGTPTPADQVIEASGDLVDPNLANLVDSLPADQRYSFLFDGNAQALDQVLVNGPMLNRLSRFHFARNDADFPESLRNDASRPERISDHDMPIAYFAFFKTPVLTLNGANPLTVECCTGFVDPGATARDDDLGDISERIEVSGSVDVRTPGSYTVTYTVSNGVLTTTATRTVVVVDTQAPTMSAPSASPSVLWPPNHQMAAITIQYQATDACDPSVTCTLSVSSSEPPAGGGSGHTAVDWEIVDSTRVKVRAERAGTGQGRVYTITATCVDRSGNARVRTTSVLVPHSKK